MAETTRCPVCGRFDWREIPVHGDKQYLNWRVRTCPCGRIELYVSGMELGETLNTAWLSAGDLRIQEWPE